MREREGKGEEEMWERKEYSETDYNEGDETELRVAPSPLSIWFHRVERVHAPYVEDPPWSAVERSRFQGLLLS